MRAVVPTIRGQIKVALGREDSRFTVRLETPPGTTARLGIPKNHMQVETITANGLVVWRAGRFHPNVRGLRSQGEDENYYLFTVTAGSWDLVAR